MDDFYNDLRLLADDVEIAAGSVKDDDVSCSLDYIASRIRNIADALEAEE
ncbi:MAG: hypothetical protein IKO25_09220 [Clostridia bacterium]|nr:hypothetical protein [Clostridia bacterium]